MPTCIDLHEVQKRGRMINRKLMSDLLTSLSGLIGPFKQP